MYMYEQGSKGMGCFNPMYFERYPDSTYLTNFELKYKLHVRKYYVLLSSTVEYYYCNWESFIIIIKIAYNTNLVQPSHMILNKILENLYPNKQ